jgi:hypothetical protein
VAAGGVLGVSTTARAPAQQGGVLGATAAAGRGTLPFTGFPIWIAVLAGLMLIGTGITVRSRSHAAARRS